MSDDLVQRLHVASTKLAALFGHMLDILGRDGVREIGLDPDSDSDVFKEAADTIARKDAEIAELRAEVAELDGIRMEIDGLTAVYEGQTAYTIVHGGRGIACNDAMRQAYSDQTIRAERAEARVREAPVARVERWAGAAWVLHKRDLETVHPPIVGKRVALVLLDTEE